MNIKQAKEHIKNSIRMYLKKNEFGEYCVPVVRQRPIFLLGAPGIGKTAVMEQIAQELGIALVSYSMTHHTRQSALGLPFITQKNYGGREYSVSEYTMSEIIATIYDVMEESGFREGILFLDEINCVSETLAPSMLQFLQYKVFGRHQVPEGWVIVTAGNPPEYNKSVREFDVVTMDRMKLLEVEPDLRVWKEYAGERGIHPAIVNFLDLKKEYFYCMEMTTKGRAFVTPRGWEDLSQMLFLYEGEKLIADESLVGQYIRNDRIVKEFAVYYELYNKYKKDYQINEILSGNIPEQAITRAKEAAFDERLSVLGMLLDRVQADMKDVMEQADFLQDLLVPLRAVEAGSAGVDSAAIIALLDKLVETRRKQMEKEQTANSMSDAGRRKHLRVIRFLEECRKALFAGGVPEGVAKFGYIKEKYNAEVTGLQLEAVRVQGELHSLFVFAEAAFDEGNEMLILVTELTVNNASAQFIATFGSPDYQRHNKELMLSERSLDLKAEIDKLGI